MKVGEIVPYIDRDGVKHNAIVCGVNGEALDLLSVDEAKAQELFGTGSWESVVHRKLAVLPSTHEKKDADDPRHCYVAPAKEEKAAAEEPQAAEEVKAETIQ